MSKFQWRSNSEAVHRVLSQSTAPEGHTIREIARLIEKQYHIPLGWNSSKLQKHVRSAVNKALNKTVQRISAQRYTIINSSANRNNNNDADSSSSETESESKQEEKSDVLLDTVGVQPLQSLARGKRGQVYDDGSNLSNIRKKYPKHFSFEADFSDIIEDKLPTLHIGNFVVPCEHCAALHPYSERQGGSSLAKPRFNMSKNNVHMQKHTKHTKNNPKQ